MDVVFYGLIVNVLFDYDFSFYFLHGLLLSLQNHGFHRLLD